MILLAEALPYLALIATWRFVRRARFLCGQVCFRKVVGALLECFKFSLLLARWDSDITGLYIFAIIYIFVSAKNNSRAACQLFGCLFSYHLPHILPGR